MSLSSISQVSSVKPVSVTPEMAMSNIECWLKFKPSEWPCTLGMKVCPEWRWSIRQSLGGPNFDVSVIKCTAETILGFFDEDTTDHETQRTRARAIFDETAKQFGVVATSFQRYPVIKNEIDEVAKLWNARRDAIAGVSSELAVGPAQVDAIELAIPTQVDVIEVADVVLQEEPEAVVVIEEERRAPIVPSKEELQQMANQILRNAPAAEEQAKPNRVRRKVRKQVVKEEQSLPKEPSVSVWNNGPSLAERLKVKETAQKLKSKKAPAVNTRYATEEELLQNATYRRASMSYRDEASPEIPKRRLGSVYPNRQESSQSYGAWNIDQLK